MTFSKSCPKKGETDIVDNKLKKLYNKGQYIINGPMEDSICMGRNPQAKRILISLKIKTMNLAKGDIFLSTRHPDASYQVWSQLAFRLRK